MKDTVLRWRDRLHDPALTALLGLEMLLIFVLSPMRALGMPLPSSITLLLVLGLMAIVVLLSRSTAAIGLVLASAALAVSGTIMHLRNPSIATDFVSAAGEIMARGTLGWVVAVAVFAPGRITHYRVQGAVVLYLNVAMIFAVLYRLVAELSPDAFQGIPAQHDQVGPLANLIYYSLSTLTTNGFGDIVPVHPIARSLTNLEAIIGQLYPATLLARVVTLELSQRRIADDERSGPITPGATGTAPDTRLATSIVAAEVRPARRPEA